LANVTPSVLVAQIVANACIPLVAGEQARTQPPAEGIWLDDAQRKKLGIQTPGRTAAYNVGGTSVFLDLGTNTSTLWFGGRDARNALAALEAEVKRTRPNLAQIKDDAHPGIGGVRLRNYTLDLNKERLAQLEVMYMTPGGAPSDDDKFKVTVYAYGKLPDDAAKKG